MGTGPVPESVGDAKAIFFDFGDTLSSIEPTKEELFIEAAACAQLKLELEQVKRAYRMVDFHNKYSSISHASLYTRKAFYRKYNEELCKALGISSYYQKLDPFLVSCFETKKQWRLLTGTFEVLSYLSGLGIPMALIANWDRTLADLTDHLGIRKFFACIISSQEAGIEKPDPRIFKLPMDVLALATQSDRIIYVGNEYGADVLGARAAGLIPVLIDKDDNYPHADCLRFRSITDWFRAFKGNKES